MITFSPTSFRANSSAVFNSVQANGCIAIESKSRPDMVLVLKDDFDHLNKSRLSAINIAETAMSNIEEMLSIGALSHHPSVEIDALIDGVRYQLKGLDNE